jgi:hypothetical protein
MDLHEHVEDLQERRFYGVLEIRFKRAWVLRRAYDLNTPE